MTMVQMVTMVIVTMVSVVTMGTVTMAITSRTIVRTATVDDMLVTIPTMKTLTPTGTTVKAPVSIVWTITIIHSILNRNQPTY